ncbi:hypothetical protein GWK47_009949 [Chionoecetes opilio]|uniref:Uncharacterized protein n=1 Tax=Chionoecetes opilio TaxID=41210 RepID=A0A8J4XYG0_CHIOP|nr:hypothetical protein GWK47_009949 [Chionoecetes opilio]
MPDLFTACLGWGAAVQLFSGVVVTTFTTAGFVGSLIMVTVANRTGALTSTIKLVDGLAVVFIIFLMEVSAPVPCAVAQNTPALSVLLPCQPSSSASVYLVPGQHALLIFSAIPFGIFSCGVYPLLLEMGVEATYPVEETISTTLIYLAGQVLGLIIIYISTVVSGDLPPQLQDVEVCTAGLTSDLQARDYSGGRQRSSTMQHLRLGHDSAASQGLAVPCWLYPKQCGRAGCLTAGKNRRRKEGGSIRCLWPSTLRQQLGVKARLAGAQGKVCLSERGRGICRDISPPPHEWQTFAAGIDDWRAVDAATHARTWSRRPTRVYYWADNYHQHLTSSLVRLTLPGRPSKSHLD